ncbi:hypothetical protein KCP78_09060 [Salmonella enterica subsp. enterica]|nr:hypothetical protein KCP78_09060 [Salmonella enterica subsp. enterica]
MTTHVLLEAAGSVSSWRSTLSKICALGLFTEINPPLQRKMRKNALNHDPLLIFASGRHTAEQPHF